MFFSLLNPEFATHDKDGSLFETWKESMRSGGVVTPTANTKVMAGVTLLEITTPDPTTKVMETPTTKVTVTAPHHGHTPPQLLLSF